jgi:hypothetical protein
MKTAPQTATTGRPRLSPRAAFSLTEVVLSVGVIAFALTSLTGLLVVGLDTNKNSTDETRSIYIAQQLLSDLRGSELGHLGVSNNKRTFITKVKSTLNNVRPEERQLAVPTSGAQNVDVKSMDVSNSNILYLNLDDNGDALGELNSQQYQDGMSDGLYSAKIELLDHKIGTEIQPGIKRVRITVGSPIRTADSKREHFIYDSLVSTL